MSALQYLNSKAELLRKNQAAAMNISASTSL